MSGKHIYVPLITPLDEQSRICEASVRRLLHCSRPFVDGYIPCLTSGEGWRLGRRDWQRMLELTLAHAQDKTVIAGIERATTAEVIEYAVLAQKLGAQAIMFTSPFAPGTRQQHIIEHYRSVHDATSLDIFIYNESALSGNEKSFETLLAIAQLPRVIGIKDSPSQPRVQSEIERLRSEGLDYFIGWEMLLARDLESDGNVVSLANLEPGLCRMAIATRQTAVGRLVETLNEHFELGADDWYAQVKKELKARGVISTDRVLAEQEALA
ncbi:dihydrodipicolinate synthase family protein [Pseudomonas sp. SWRI102]|uniref:Dihydrodipicolinate synthase family protein n=1 Tax=Pseudomonas marvdashtae TaxID=2745500 RepID=A0A923FQ81_9PSED|nr:dihydrodipicolinate synthase family protein [Pseudomonas marvdashtae]MBV4553776.1 dihydrodipicolinate synthase family protein [Pseudomonas marvdashtae]